MTSVTTNNLLSSSTTFKHFCSRIAASSSELHRTREASFDPDYCRKRCLLTLRNQWKYCQIRSTILRSEYLKLMTSYIQSLETDVRVPVTIIYYRVVRVQDTHCCGGSRIRAELTRILPAIEVTLTADTQTDSRRSTDGKVSQEKQKKAAVPTDGMKKFHVCDTLLFVLVESRETEFTGHSRGVSNADAWKLGAWRSPKVLLSAGLCSVRPQGSGGVPSRSREGLDSSNLATKGGM